MRLWVRLTYLSDLWVRLIFGQMYSPKVRLWVRLTFLSSLGHADCWSDIPPDEASGQVDIWSDFGQMNPPTETSCVQVWY